MAEEEEERRREMRRRKVKVRGKMQRDKVIVIQQNLSNTDTLGPK